MSTTLDAQRPVDPATGKRRRHTLADIYHERTNFDFIGRSWRWAILSGVLIVVSLAALAVRQLNLGIEFTGGTAFQVTVQGKSPSVADVRDVLAAEGIDVAKVTVVGSNQVRVQSEELTADEKAAVQDSLAGYAGVERGDVTVADVGASWGEDVSQKALTALVAFFIVIALYLWLRFEWKMAMAALLAVVHDIIVTVGVYAITQFEVTPATVVAFLTILGFSLYDTVVVFDKIKENTALLGTERGDTYSNMVNRSMNQVLMRSLNTSFVALLPVASLLVVGIWLFGALVLRDFALALFVGLLTGAYSSIFVATPILAWWKEREPRYRSLRARSAVAEERAAVRAAATGARSADAGIETAAAAAPDGADAAPPRTPTPSATPAAPGRGTGPEAAATEPGVVPRPRQQRRRKRK